MQISAELAQNQLLLSRHPHHHHHHHRPILATKLADVPMSLTSVHVNALEFKACVTAVIHALNSTLDRSATKQRACDHRSAIQPRRKERSSAQFLFWQQCFWNSSVWEELGSLEAMDCSSSSVGTCSQEVSGNP